MPIDARSPHQWAAHLLSLLDLTSLGERDTAENIEDLCAMALASPVYPAALCVYPEHLTTARRQVLDTSIKLATVVNFPDGSRNVGRVERETARAIGAGADEIDLVLPYLALLSGDTATPIAVVRAARAVCGPDIALKLIIESGELKTSEMIRLACSIGLDEGVDFLKTSTGKVPVNATLEAAGLMMEAIASSGCPCGFKAAGGIRTLAQAQAYVRLAETSMGARWVTPVRFRIGASALFSELTAVMETP